ncbi:Acg family FMN-binding oxidoreductase [Clostridium brassicae]|uniref:Nitroreductase domain-containing protein n=1 Tax=Clostridium brassicae TaxID=2999072 RepID=A0ABT4DCY3_9CLOT|nr:hypothetical protein [Clostridium brassicae]MCY6960176.1 hypothetical protein [Clostridium brassicae]
MNRKVKKIMIYFLSGIVSIILLCLIVIFVASGIFSKQEYLKPWDKGYSQKFDDPRLKLTAHGILASNSHNMQPWKIKLDNNKDVFYLFVDSERLTKEVDPYARQIMITQGTFLENVKIAGEKLGYKTKIDLFPHGEYDEQNLVESMKEKPVAKITIRKTQPKESVLYDYIFLPDTNRGPYEKTKLNETQVKKLLAINTKSDLVVKLFQDEANINIMGNYAIEGAKIEAGIHRINEETKNIFRSNEYEKNKYRYGYSVEGQGTSGIMKHIMQGIITLVPSINSEKQSANMFIKSTENVVENTSAYVMIISNNNNRVQQVKSGMLYSRLILAAHSEGIVVQPVSQVLEEYSEMEKQYNKIHEQYAPKGSTIQLFIRIGKPKQKFPQSMRSDVMELVRLD